MASRDNPFPGMNPFLEASWHDVHTRLVVTIANQLAGQLPEGLVARTEENIAIAESVDSYRPDVALVGTAHETFPSVRLHEGAAAPAGPYTEPIIVFSEPETERWVEVLDVNGRLVTAIEVLSRTNKSDDGWRSYKGKQRDLLAAGVNLVEVDFIRGGQHVVAVSLDTFRRPKGTCYLICVARPDSSWRRELYPCPLREPLPTIRVPLRPGDKDATLSFQPMIDEIYRFGAYWTTAYRHPLDPPLPPDDAAWVEERLKAAGLK